MGIYKLTFKSNEEVRAVTETIDGLCERFRKGVMVRVHLHWPENQP